MSCSVIPGVEVEIVSNAPPGPVCLDNPLVTRLREVGSLEVRPEAGVDAGGRVRHGGVDAVNLGPGDPRYAHRDDEQVTEAALVAGARDRVGVPGRREP